MWALQDACTGLYRTLISVFSILHRLHKGPRWCLYELSRWLCYLDYYYAYDTMMIFCNPGFKQVDSNCFYDLRWFYPDPGLVRSGSMAPGKKFIVLYVTFLWYLSHVTGSYISWSSQRAVLLVIIIHAWNMGRMHVSCRACAGLELYFMAGPNMKA